MASTPSTILRLELMATGEKKNVWGDIANTVFKTLERATCGVATVDVASPSTTLSITNYVLSTAHNRVWNLTGTLTQGTTLIVPSLQMVKTVYNGTTGGYTVTVKTASGTGVAVPNGKRMTVVCDGVNVTEADTYLRGDVNGDVNGNLTGNVTGNLTGNVTGNLTGNVTGNVTGDLTGDVAGNAATASKWKTARTLTLTGDASGSISMDGGANYSMTVTVNHESIAGLQGGTTSQHYHLTSAQHANVISAAPVWGGVTFTNGHVEANGHVYGGNVNTGFSASSTAISWQINGTTRLICSATYLRPGGDNDQALGGSGVRWSSVYAVDNTINTSDAREKTPVRAMTAAEIEASKALAREIGAYQWLSAVEKKGAAAREHIGMTVQRAIEIMEAHGLDPFRYGFVCYDEWSDEEETGLKPGNRYSFRLSELLLFIARGLEARLSAAGL
jgi:hypothetical protein